MALILSILQLKAIGECLSIPTYDMYKETAQTDIVGSNSTSNSTSSSSGAATDSSGAAGLRIPSSAFMGVAAAAVVAAFAGSL